MKRFPLLDTPTCHTFAGGSMIDWALASPDVIIHVQSFSVGQKAAESDHVPLLLLGTFPK